MRYGSVRTIRSYACHLFVWSHCVFATVVVADQVADREHDGERYKTFEHWIVEHHYFSHVFGGKAENQLFREDVSLLSMG